MPPAIDALGRRLHDLRISVTDRCNFRCPYCMPAEIYGEHYQFLAKPELLTFEEIERLARLAIGLGVEKLRITGGEPLLRHQLPSLVGRLAALDGLRDLTLTTNGVLLDKFAKPLVDAGLDRVTVSLDSLDPETSRRMSGRDVDPSRVLAGIEAGRARGTAADQAQLRGAARRQRPRDRRPGAPLPRHRPHRALHRVHGCGHPQPLGDLSKRW